MKQSMEKQKKFEQKCNKKPEIVIFPNELLVFSTENKERKMSKNAK